MSSCNECAEQANGMPNQAGFFQPSAAPSRQPWAEISMDGVTKLPGSVHRGEPVDQCLVISDNLSGLTRLLPAHSTNTAEVTAERCFLETFSTMGLPRSIRADNDNDKLLVCAFWNRLMTLLGVDMHYTSPASSRSNGGCERKNQEFNRQVRLAVASAGKDWVRSLPLHEFAMNRRSAAHRAGHSPFMIDRGHEPRGFTDLMGVVEGRPLDSPAALAFFHKRAHVAQEAVDAMVISQDEVARSQNRLHRGEVCREGDWVRVHKTHFSSPAARELESFKVQPNWVGPFRVLQVGESGKIAVCPFQKCDRRMDRIVVAAAPGSAVHGAPR